MLLYSENQPRMTQRVPDGLYEGKIQHHGRFAFLLAEGSGHDDLMLRGPSLSLAMDGDIVQARVIPGKKGRRPSGEIVKVLKRARATVTGVLRKHGPDWLVVPEEADERDGVRVIKFPKGSHPKAGLVVVVKITTWPTFRESAAGEICESLGMAGESGVRMRAVLRTRDLPDEFPEGVLAESRMFPAEVSPDMARGRRDLRELPVFTIDGADAKDFDDAVSIEVINDHTMRLGVHIADVSHYVKKGTVLDLEAAKRATSVYLADRVVPMLPPNLSDHLCSLMPEVDRLTMSCFMDLGKDGHVRDTSLEETVIRSCRRFTYEEVESVMKGGEVSNVSPRVREAVIRMGVLFKTLLRGRIDRGALDMNNSEYQVVMGEDGHPKDVIQRPRLDSHRLIEEFMLLANETVARTLLERRLPFLSRVHPDPDPKKLEALTMELKKLGFHVPLPIKAGSSRGLQMVLKKAVGHPLEDTINLLVVRSLKQASYSSVPGGHFGLASKAYCHFTSPIRRYPDLVTHRAVRAFLQKKSDPNLGQGLRDLGEHCSNQERLAADAERRSVDIMRAELLKKRVGEVFQGVVSGTADFGVFVTLKGLGATGLLRGGSAALGSEVEVRLDQVNEGKGELDLSSPVGNRPRIDPAAKRRFEPRHDRPRSDKPWHKRRDDKPRHDRPRSDKPWHKSRDDKPRHDRPRSDEPWHDRPRSDKPWHKRRDDKPGHDRPQSDKPRHDRPRSDKPRHDRPQSDKPWHQKKFDPDKPKHPFHAKPKHPFHAKPGSKPKHEGDSKPKFYERFLGKKGRKRRH